MEQSYISRKTLRPLTVRLETLHLTGTRQKEKAKIIINDLFVIFYSIHYEMEYFKNLNQMGDTAPRTASGLAAVRRPL
jgi:hypothetical protein